MHATTREPTPAASTMAWRDTTQAEARIPLVDDEEAIVAGDGVIADADSGR
jgi:hypothetical protein